MNNLFSNQHNVTPEEASLMELHSALQSVYENSQKDEHSSLIALISHLHAILTQKFEESPPLVRPKDYNLSTAVYEKCLRIKERNERMKVDVLNIRASLARLMSHSTQPLENDRAYTDMMTTIRRKSMDVRAKIEKCRAGSQAGPASLTSSELLRSGEVVELKRGAEWLQKKALELRREVEVWREYCSNQYAA